MPRPRFAAIPLVATLTALMLAGCDRREPEPDPRLDRDPVIAAALNDPLLADPDLTSQNLPGAALRGGGPPAAEIPPYKRGDAEVAAARAAALAQARIISPAPAPTRSEPASPAANAATAVTLARRVLNGRQACAESLRYGFIWAARVPAPFELYPRSHAEEAAGSDAVGCRVRVVRFASAVPVGDLVDYYYSRGSDPAFRAERWRAGGDEVLRVTGKGLTITLFARPRDDGMSEADLVTDAG